MAISKNLRMHWLAGLKLTLLLSFLSPYCRAVVWAESNPSAATVPPMENQNALEPKKSLAATVTQAIQLYREKNYVEADRLFTQLHSENPDKTKTTYYLAITKAQEGDLMEASRLYQEVIQRESGSPLGMLAQQGLKNIPLTATANVDAPPQFPNPYGADASSSYMPNASPTGSNSMPGVSPQDLMWMQTMMGTSNGNGNNNNSNTNDWGSWMAGIDANNNAMSGMTGAMSVPGMAMPNTMMPGGNMPIMNNGRPVDPQVMSSWLTNQMMQNSTLFMNDDNDKH